MNARWIVVAALLAGACTKSEDVAKPAETSSGSKSDPKIDAKIAGQLEVQKAILTQKEEVMHNLEARFDEVTQRIDALREKFEKAGPEVRENAATLLTDVRVRQASLKNDLAALKSVVVDKWKDASKSFEKTLQSLEEDTVLLISKVK